MRGIHRRPLIDSGLRRSFNWFGSDSNDPCRLLLVGHCAVPEPELADLIAATHIVTRAIVATLEPQGFNIFSNNGKAAGQSVFHMHFHVTPRYDGDNIRFILELKKYHSEEMSAYGERLRKQIQLSHA